MSQWIERIQTHQIFKEVAALDDALEASRPQATSDPTLYDAWDRITRVNGFIKVYLVQMDPLLVPLSVLSNCVNNFVQIRHNLNIFATNSNLNSLIDANNQIDAVLTLLAAIPRASEPLSEFSSAAENYRENIGKLISHLRVGITDCMNDIRMIESRLATLGTEVNASKERADNVIAQMQQQFAAAQDARQVEALNHEAKRTSDFETSQEIRATINSEIASDAQKNLESLLADLKEKHSTITQSLTVTGESVVKTLQQQKEYAEKIVGIISTEAVAHGYGKTANEEKAAAKSWRILAVLTLLGWIVAGVVFFAFTYDKDLSVSAMARQFLISTPFVLLSGFAALQVTKHQRAERINRQQELEIAAIDPYLASFDETTRKEVKKALAEKIFGQREVEQTKGDTKQVLDTVSDTLKVVKQLQDALKK